MQHTDCFSPRFRESSVTRPLLSLRPKAGAQPANDGPPPLGENAGAEPILKHAIVRARCLHATYNSGQVILHPCLLYREHDALFLLAVTVLRDGKAPREAKLGTFRVSGLAELTSSPESFAPSALHKDWTVKPGWSVIAGLRDQDSAAAWEKPEA